MKRKPILCAALTLALLLLCPSPAHAQVSATAETSAQAGAVYVAGNPDCYPIEYYDGESQCYRGVMPELLEDISQATGVDFVYIAAGSEDRRAGLAENRQVELLSGCLLGQELLPRTQAGQPILSVTVEGETFQAAFCYTEIADDGLRTLIEDYISALPDGEMTRRAVTFAAENGRLAVPLWVWIAMGAVCVSMAALALWAVVRMKRKAREDEVNRQVDPGTGAWNRQYFLRQFSRQVNQHTRPLCYLIYLRFDIGRVNEYYGEDEAEALLRHMADALGRSTAEPDFFARVSGGGFACLRQYASQEQAAEWTGEILTELNGYSGKFGRDYAPEFHAGIYPLEPEATCEMALYAAGQGCRLAEQGGQPYLLCDGRLLRSSQETESLRHDVIRAVENREFQCHLQLIAQADTGAVCGAELLSRWHHPDLGLLMPEKYIRSMEESGTITELDFYMFEEACRLLAQFEAQGWPELELFCNFSRRTVSLADFSARLERIARQYRFDRSRLCLEITESCMFEREEDARESIRQCRQAGFLIALDDVGSGYSSFGDLANYPVEIAKIDRSLLLAAVSENSPRLLRGMNALFHSLQIQTLCEGVETPEQRRLVQELGIDLIQGFCVQRALPVEEALRWLRETGGVAPDAP